MKIVVASIASFGALAFLAVLVLTKPSASTRAVEPTPGVAPAEPPLEAPARFSPIVGGNGVVAPRALPAAAAAPSPAPTAPAAPALELAGRSTREMQKALKERQRARAEAAGRLDEYEAREAQRESRREARRQEREARRAAANERRERRAAESRAREAAFQAGAEPPHPRQRALEARLAPEVR